MSPALYGLKYINALMIGYAAFKIFAVIKHIVRTAPTAAQTAPEAVLPSYVLMVVFGLFFLYLTWLNFRTVRAQLRDERRAGLKVVVLNSLWLALQITSQFYAISIMIRLMTTVGMDNTATWRLLIALTPIAMEWLYLLANIINAWRSRRRPTLMEKVFS